MWLIVFMIIIIAAVIVCFSLAAAAKNAEMISQLWLESKVHKTGNLCTNKTKRSNRKCKNQGILLTQFELK